MKLKNYWEPTPKFARAFGDALLSIGALCTTYNIVTDDKYVAMFCLACGVIGKFMTNFFTHEDI
jgi:hypothetical protein